MCRHTCAVAAPRGLTRPAEPFVFVTPRSWCDGSSALPRCHTAAPLRTMKPAAPRGAAALALVAFACLASLARAQTSTPRLVSAYPDAALDARLVGRFVATTARGVDRTAAAGAINRGVAAGLIAHGSDDLSNVGLGVVTFKASTVNAKVRFSGRQTERNAPTTDNDRTRLASLPLACRPFSAQTQRCSPALRRSRSSALLRARRPLGRRRRVPRCRLPRPPRCLPRRRRPRRRRPRRRCSLPTRARPRRTCGVWTCCARPLQMQTLLATRPLTRRLHLLRSQGCRLRLRA